MALISAQKLHTWSRRRDFLLQGAIGILLVSVVVAWILWGLTQTLGQGRRLFSSAEEAVEVVRRAPLHLTGERLRAWMERGTPGLLGVPGLRGEEDVASNLVQVWVARNVIDRLSELGLEEELGDLLTWYGEGRYGAARLRQDHLAKLMQAGESGRPYAWELAGDLALMEKEREEARSHYRSELSLRASRYAADQLLAQAIHLGGEAGRERLRELREDSEVWRAAGPGTQLEAAVQLRDWSALAVAVLRADYLENQLSLVILALAVAALWFVIVVQFAGFGREQWALYLTAVFLGMLSASATIYAYVIQDQILEVAQDGDDVVTGVIHYVAGVGLREEFLKLLFFVPLVPWLLRRGRAIDALVAAGLVGLGFALNENLGYFHRGQQDAAIGRLLTANIAHVAWTGAIGFALFRMAWFKGRTWDEFVGTFLVVVLAHGFYDAFIAVPQMAGDGGIVSTIILALSVWRYFDLTENHFRPSGMRLSVLSVFVLGTALMVGLTMNILVFGQRPFPAALYYLASAAQLIPVAFIFIHRFRDS